MSKHDSEQDTTSPGHQIPSTSELGEADLEAYRAPSREYPDSQHHSEQHRGSDVEKGTTPRPGDRHETSSDTTAAHSGSPCSAAAKQEPVVERDADGNEVIWVEWEENDSGNPLNWNLTRKWVTTTLSLLFTFLTADAGAMYASGIPSMERDLKNDPYLSNVGIAMYPLGFGIPPMILAPFSEVYGRNAVYLPSMLLWTLFFLPVALGNNMGAVLVGRFLGGAAGSTGSTMVGGTIADMWDTHERGLPMALFSLAAFSGMGTGPVYAGWTEHYLGWRWIEWVTMIAGGVVLVFFTIFLRESRASVLLSRRAAKLREKTGDMRYRCRADEERSSLLVMIKTSLSRPIIYLLTEPVIFSFSLWISFVWGMMWALLQSMSLVFGNVYGFNSGELGSSFASIVVGALVGFATMPIQERIYAKRYPKDGAEARLYMSCVGGVAVPIGAFIFGWTQGNGPWIAPLIGVAVMLFGLYTVYQAIFSYLADSYSLYASSAIAGQSLARNLMGFAFPLFTTQMYENLGYDYAATVVGCISAALAIIPFVLIKYGPKLREKSKALQELERDKQKILEKRMREREQLERHISGTVQER